MARILVIILSIALLTTGNAAVKKLRFFTIDMHSATTHDMIDIFHELGHEVEFLTISDYARFHFNRTKEKVNFLPDSNWREISPASADLFYNQYKDYMESFDGFLVTPSSPWVLLFEKFNKPIIIANAVRYEMPFTDRPNYWRTLDRVLKKGVNEGKIFIVANNKGDAKYLEYYTGLKSILISSLCAYTNAEYTGVKDQFITHTRFYSYFPDRIKNRFKNPDLVNTQIQRGYSWQDLCDYKGIIHFPYQCSYMSLFEQYYSNIPLFFPSKKFLSNLFAQHRDKGIMREVSLFCEFNKMAPPTTKGNPNNLEGPLVREFWINSADFYDQNEMPYIQYFDNLTHLEELLQTADLKAISQDMKAHNVKRKERILKQWEQLLEKIYGTPPNNSIND